MSKIRRLLTALLASSLLFLGAMPATASTTTSWWQPNDETPTQGFDSAVYQVNFSADTYYLYAVNSDGDDMQLIGGAAGSFEDQTIYFIEDSVTNKWYASTDDSLSSGDLWVGDSWGEIQLGLQIRDASGDLIGYVVSGPDGDTYTLTGDSVGVMVKTSDLQPVPVPGTAFLLGSGLLGLIGTGVRRRRSST